MHSECDQFDFHWKYIEHKDFVNKSLAYKEQILARITLPDDQDMDRDIICSNLHTFLAHMSDLTGLIILKSKKKVKYCGTGLVIKIRMQTNSQCPCPLEHGHTEFKTEHAIVTVSTTYHVFNKPNETGGYQDTFEKANLIWGKYQQELKLDYNGPDRQLQDFFNCTDLPTLYGYRIVETDKDLDNNSDWCAAEFVTHDRQLINKLKGVVSNYQSGLANLYKMSLEYRDVDLIVIVGHPHCWAKRTSIGGSWKLDTGKSTEILKEIRDRQRWCTYYYDALTCEGSSGSPVFKWGQAISGFGYWFGHPHNHCEGDSDEDGSPVGRSTIGVEHKC